MTGIVIASSDEAVIASLESAVTEVGGFEVVARPSSSHAVHDALVGEGTDVLVLDQALGPVPALDLARQVSRQHPFVAVLLLARDNDPELLRAGMEAGLRGFLTLPLSVDDVASRLDNAASWSATVRHHISGDALQSIGTGHLLAVAGGKGGVGTSTVAIRLALLSAAAGRRTALIDLDLLTGDVGAFLDISHRRDITDLIDVRDEITGRALDDVLYRYDDNLYVLLAPKQPERAEEIDSRLARNLLGAAKSYFDVVVVDAGATPSAANAIAAEIADEAVVVITPDIPSMRGARRLVQLWESLQLRKEDDVHLLLNRASRKAEIQSDLARKLVKAPMLSTSVPADFPAFESAANTGDPGRVTDQAVGRAFGELALELELVPQKQKPVPSRHKGSRRSRRGRDDGQVAVEFLGMFFVIALTLLLLVQGGLIGYTYVAAGHAANTAARVAVSPTKGFSDIQRAALDELPQAWRDHAQVTVNGATGFGPGSDPRYSDPDAVVSVQVRTPLIFTSLGGLLDGVRDVDAQSQMRFEGTR
ncbi:MAG TPA: AAA family ATPase [Actinomycetales bacterium]|nr:AAA family ATPase [Actinomycetales bacterium]